jgi:hypothetical protein
MLSSLNSISAVLLVFYQFLLFETTLFRERESNWLFKAIKN